MKYYKMQLPGDSFSSETGPSFGRISGAPYHLRNLGPPEINGIREGKRQR